TLHPSQPSVRPGAMGTRARDGLRPNNPQHEAGPRIEPPPSVACAIGRTPAATSADAPPDEPPEVRVKSQGFRVAPWSVDSVVAAQPNSGAVELQKMLRPAAWNRLINTVSSAPT